MLYSTLALFSATQNAVNFIDTPIKRKVHTEFSSTMLKFVFSSCNSLTVFMF